MEDITFKGKKYNLQIERDGKYFVGEVPELEACYTQAGSIAELRKRMREVIGLCLEVGSGMKERSMEAKRTRMRIPHAKIATA